MNKIKTLASMLTALLFALWMSPAGAEPVSVALSPSADTYLRGGNYNANEGASPFLRVRASGNNRALVIFDQQEIESLVCSGNLISAHLELFIDHNADNWGDGRAVDAHRLLSDWAEGNGKTAGLPGPARYRGDGPGATWRCPVDPDIANLSDDDADYWNPGLATRFQGGRFAESPTDTIIIEKGLVGWVSWDVTADVADFLSGDADNFGWIVKKTIEGLAGLVEFSSREGINPPRLVLVYESSECEPPQDTIILGANKDAYLRSGSLNTNEGANPGLRMQASGNNRLIIGFDLDEVDLTGLTKATLVLSLLENTDNWGTANDRTIDVHRLLTDWAEGNGKNTDIPTSQRYRGDGPGATWVCPVDPDIDNSNDDGATKWKPGKPNAQQGGDFATATAPSVLFFNGYRGQVQWDVTQDVLDGAEDGWLVKKTRENLSGKAIFYSREGAVEAGDADLAPKLILEFGSAPAAAF